MNDIIDFQGKKWKVLSGAVLDNYRILSLEEVKEPTEQWIEFEPKIRISDTNEVIALDEGLNRIAKCITYWNISYGMEDSYKYENGKWFKKVKE